MYSTPSPITYGVPQGSVLGPLLFLLYCSQLHYIVSGDGIRGHYFADDVQLYGFFKPSTSQQHSTYAALSSCISRVKGWMDKNKLKLNEDKTDALLVTSAKRKLHLDPASLLVNDIPITPSVCVRNLGVLLDSHPTMERHISATCRKAFFHLRRIARIKRFLSPAATAQLVNAFVSS